MSTNARLVASASGCWTLSKKPKNLPDTQSWGDITYPVGNKNKEEVYVVSSSACRLSAYVAISKAPKTSKSARKRNIPIGISSTSTTALYPNTTQLLQCMSGAIWVLHQNRKRGWSCAAAWLGRGRPERCGATRLLACAEMAVGCGEESPARDKPQRLLQADAEDSNHRRGRRVQLVDFSSST